MKCYVKELIAGGVAAFLLAGGAWAADFSQMADAQDHWARWDLERAVGDGVLQGNENGVLAPDDSLSGGELAAILCRYLDARTAVAAYPGAADDWYAADAAKAAVLGILPLDGSIDCAYPVTRAQTFQAMAAAFQLMRAAPDEAWLSGFTDVDTLSPAQRRAAAVLLENRILQGSDGKLEPQRAISRAEFVTMLYRLAGARGGQEVLDTQDGMAVVVSEDVLAQGKTLQKPVLLAPPVQYAIFRDVTMHGQLAVRGANMDTLMLDNVQGPALALAQTGTLSVTPENGTHFDTVVIGAGDGEVSLNGSFADTVEITGDRRFVRLAGMELQSLVITGSGCTVYTDANTHIASLHIPQDAVSSSVTIDGVVDSAALYGSGTALQGAGRAGIVRAAGKRIAVTLAAESADQHIDNGLDGIEIALDAPTVAPGGALTATAAFSGVTEEKLCAAQWYLDGEPLENFRNDAFALTGSASKLEYRLDFSYQMPLSHTVALQLTYQNPVTGETEQRRAEATVEVENYPASHYTDQIAGKISKVYQAGKADYTQEEKELFVNTKGYESRTAYLLWVNIGRQRVNVFEGAQGNWKLMHAFECASGASGSPTPYGVTYVTAKQTAWVTSTYKCRPIVRFYPGSGYAFHSRLYAPSGRGLVDATMGRPVSHGCIRMMDDGIYWLYENVPLNTTVVIY